MGLASVGYGLGNGLRFEIEGNFRQNHNHSTTGTPFPTASGGNNNTFGVMVNALYDFDIEPYTGITWMYPYLGAGVGYAWTHLKGYHSYGTDFPYFLQTNDHDGKLCVSGHRRRLVPDPARTGPLGYGGVPASSGSSGTRASTVRSTRG